MSEALLSVDLFAPTFAELSVMTHELVLEISFLLVDLQHIYECCPGLFPLFWRLQTEGVGDRRFSAHMLD